MIVDDPFYRWLLSRGYAPSTAGGYVEIVARWKGSSMDAGPWLAGEQERLRSVATGLPTATIHRYKAGIQAYQEFTTGKRGEIEIPRYVRREHPNPPAILTVQEDRRIADVLASGDLREPQASVVRLVRATGARIGEACGVELTEILVQPTGLSVVFPRTKTRVPRTVPLVGGGVVDLCLYLRQRGDASPWAFPSPQDPKHHVTEAAVRQFCGELAHLAGVPRIHPHAFRHRLITRLHAAGVDKRTIQAIVGHRAEGVTGGYTHPDDATMRAALLTLR